MVPPWSPRGLDVVPGISNSGLGVVSAWPWASQTVVSEWSRRGLGVVPGISNSGPRVVSGWSRVVPGNSNSGLRWFLVVSAWSRVSQTVVSVVSAWSRRGPGYLKQWSRRSPKPQFGIPETTETTV